MLLFKLSSHTQYKFASPQNCQKWFSLLPSKSVYGLLSQNHSLKENDWLSNPSSSSVIFNKHFSVVSFREKIIALLCFAGLSGNNARRERTWELCSLSFPFASSECFQQQGSQRRGEKDRACSHWQNFSHLHWDKGLAMLCSIPSLGLRTSVAPHGRLALLRDTALADNSALTSIQQLLFSFPQSGYLHGQWEHQSWDRMKGRLCTTLAGLTFIISAFVFALFPYIPAD